MARYEETRCQVVSFGPPSSPQSARCGRETLRCEVLVWRRAQDGFLMAEREASVAEALGRVQWLGPCASCWKAAWAALGRARPRPQCEAAAVQPPLPLPPPVAVSAVRCRPSFWHSAIRLACCVRGGARGDTEVCDRLPRAGRTGHTLASSKRRGFASRESFHTHGHPSSRDVRV